MKTPWAAITTGSSGGYKNVINEALRLNGEGVNCPLAIETSGHAAMRENYFLDGWRLSGDQDYH